MLAALAAAALLLAGWAQADVAGMARAAACALAWGWVRQRHGPCGAAVSRAGWVRQRHGPRGAAVSRVAWASLLLATGAAALAGHHGPAAWLPACALLGSSLGAPRRLPEMLLAALAAPWEQALAPTLDPWLGRASAVAAATTLAAAGYDVVAQGPALIWHIGAPLQVNVTGQCAGIGMVLAHLALGAVWAGSAARGRRGGELLVVPLVAGAGNVLRIALCALAARRWAAADDGRWELAHAWIGHGVGGATYLALACLARARHHAVAHSPPSGSSTRSPRRTHGVRVPA